MLKRAKTMRKESAPAETKLWSLLRDRRLSNIKFRRQVPIGSYIADFVCFQPKLIIEADGGQHCKNSYDKQRDTWFETQGFLVLRFWNADILKTPQNVLGTILAKAHPNE